MNLICITESELAQWASRRYLDTLSARVIASQDGITLDIFSTFPYLKLEDARGRVIVCLKDDWKELSSRINASPNIEIMSIPLGAIIEIIPTMDQYAEKLLPYKLPIARWSVERIWKGWLLNQAVSEVYRATVSEISKIGFVDNETINNEPLIRAMIKKSLQPNVSSVEESLLIGWDKVLENRDAWIQSLRVDGHLNNTGMLKASVKMVRESLFQEEELIEFRIADDERGWEIRDITEEILQQFLKHTSSRVALGVPAEPPLFCIASYLRLYDELHNGERDWRVIFNLLRFTKYSVNSLHADFLTIALVSSLKTEEIYSLRLRDLY
jgi:hypothetical protein